jgi:hypothetical protein
VFFGTVQPHERPWLSLLTKAAYWTFFPLPEQRASSRAEEPSNHQDFLDLIHSMSGIRFLLFQLFCRQLYRLPRRCGYGKASSMGTTFEFSMSHVILMCLSRIVGSTLVHENGSVGKFHCQPPNPLNVSSIAASISSSEDRTTSGANTPSPGGAGVTDVDGG